MCKELDQELERGDKAFREVATHLHNMGACKTTQDINIFETADVFRVTVKRICGDTAGHGLLKELKSVSLRGYMRRVADDFKQVISKHESGEAELQPQIYVDYKHDLELLDEVLGE